MWIYDKFQVKKVWIKFDLCKIMSLLIVECLMMLVTMFKCNILTKLHAMIARKVQIVNKSNYVQEFKINIRFIFLHPRSRGCETKSRLSSAFLFPKQKDSGLIVGVKNKLFIYILKR